MAIQGNQGSAPKGGGQTSNNNKGNRNTVNQGISNAGPTDNRNDRADVQKSKSKSGVVGNTDPKKQGTNTHSRSGSKSNAS